MSKADDATATLALHGDYITLAQALKVAGLAETGGQAKVLVRSGTVRVNDVVATQPGRKLRVGDRFALDGGGSCLITA